MFIKLKYDALGIEFNFIKYQIYSKIYILAMLRPSELYSKMCVCFCINSKESPQLLIFLKALQSAVVSMLFIVDKS